MNKDEKLGIIDLFDEVEVFFQNEGQTLHNAIEDAIRKASRSAVHCNKKAKIKIELTFSPGRERVMAVSGEVILTEPKIKSEPVTLYHGKDGELYNDDPRQKPLPNVHKNYEDEEEVKKANAG